MIESWIFHFDFCNCGVFHHLRTISIFVFCNLEIVRLEFYRTGPSISISIAAKLFILIHTTPLVARFGFYNPRGPLFLLIWLRKSTTSISITFKFFIPTFTIAESSTSTSITPSFSLSYDLLRLRHPLTSRSLGIDFLLTNHGKTSIIGIFLEYLRTLPFNLKNRDARIEIGKDRKIFIPRSAFPFNIHI